MYKLVCKMLKEFRFRGEDSTLKCMDNILNIAECIVGL